MDEHDNMGLGRWDAVNQCHVLPTQLCMGWAADSAERLPALYRSSLCFFVTNRRHSQECRLVSTWIAEEESCDGHFQRSLHGGTWAGAGRGTGESVGMLGLGWFGCQAWTRKAQRQH